jgi:hypothetical protein
MQKRRTLEKKKNTKNLKRMPLQEKPKKTKKKKGNNPRRGG